ncbi:ABC transporter substrate-binding protein [Cytobacillus praedii]|uniref:ABC transporter substrate-binding protein n=1 Tax=Cytobacillus praedii TaxID=1742358 RepID=UPI00070EB693|nr:ABC transporter substrate-binding protein [Cytobacillus praedii]
MEKLYKNNIHYLLVFFLLITVFLTGCSQSTDKESASQASEGQSKKTEIAEKLNELTIQAPMGISIAAPIYKVVDDNNLDEFTNQLIYMPWKNPDELRARISADQADISAVPTYVGANLYNRGMDVKLMNVLIWGILYVVGPDGEQVSWEQLKGQTIHVPFKGDMPDLVFQYLLNKNGIDTTKDIKIEYVSSPQEIVQLMIADKATFAVVPEHVATLSVVKGKQEGKNLAKIMNLQEEWKKATGRDSYIPQAGILVSNSLIEEQPELVKEIQNQFEQSVQFINENPSEAAAIINKTNEDVPKPIIEQVIPSLNLQFVSAKDAKDDLEFFFNELSTLSPEIIGGKLPDAGFYYEK